MQKILGMISWYFRETGWTSWIIVHVWVSEDLVVEENWYNKKTGQEKVHVV